MFVFKKFPPLILSRRTLFEIILSFPPKPICVPYLDVITLFGEIDKFRVEFLVYPNQVGLNYGLRKGL